MTADKKSKDEKNLEAVLGKIEEMPEAIREISKRVHAIIMESAPDLKPRIWYGMPGYATSGSAPVVVFFRHDEYMTFGLTEKSNLKPTGDANGNLMPSSWFFEDLDAKTEKRLAEIVRMATS